MGNSLLCLLGAEGPLFWGVGLAHSEGQLETARLGLGGPCLPFGGPERLVVSVGQSMLPRACSPLHRTWLKMASPSLEEWSRSLIIASARLDGIK